ncbi:MAG: DNA polymerase III subunit alpha [Alphaproteobacteria bacterium]
MHPYNFIHLRTHSSYSLSEGAIKIDDLMDLCIKNRMPAVALTDTGNLFCSLEFSKACTNNGIKPIIGTILKFDIEENEAKFTKNFEFYEILLLAKNDIGYKNLLKLVSKSFLDNNNPYPHVTISLLKEHSEGIIALSGGLRGAIDRLILESKEKLAEEVLVKLNNIFKDNFYIEISRHNIEEEDRIEESILNLAYKYNIPLVATNNIFYATRNMYEAHDALLCIAEGRYISEDDRKKTNTEYYFKSQREMCNLFADLPEAINNTLLIAERCSVKSEEHEPMLPNFEVSSNKTEIEEFKYLAYEGLNRKLENIIYKNIDPSHREEVKTKYYERLDFELSVIIEMKFPGYFLIVSDFIRWSKKNNIPVGPGRGSGAGSLVAWCLEITDLDPLRFNLLFERFLNPERISMPDFDIDFCQDRRDEVINYVQDKYGKEQVAQIITFGKLQARAVIRDVGRVLQMPYGQVDKISKMVPFNAVNPVTLSQAIEMEPALRRAKAEDEQIAKLLSIALQLEGLNRHTSTHAAGIIIAGKPLIEIVPLCRDPKTGMLVTQYSMKYAEAAGLVKFDFLGLKTLTTISNTCKLIAVSGDQIDITTIPLDDKKTYELLAKGLSVGIFQFESPGMQDTLRKMRPDVIEDLIALGALYRPGPMDNIPTYIACKHGIEEPDYLHPSLEHILKETFGVIIYQEQVMEIAQVLAGYTLGAADLLRRAMGKKIKAEMDAQREMFVEGAVKKGVDKVHASNIFDLVAKFAGYGFNKSHAAAYAMISYQTAYLKANYPVEFIVASMNLDINDTDKINVFKEEAHNMGIEILPPNINYSNSIFSIETIKGKQAIRYGLGALKNVGISAMEDLTIERKNNGHFKDIFDFANRIDSKILNKRQLENLIKAGTFDILNSNRKQLLESVEIITRYNTDNTKERNSNQISLFSSLESLKQTMPQLVKTEDYNKNERLSLECEALGFYLTDHPLNDIKNYLKILGIKDSNYLKHELIEGSSIVKLAAVSISTKTRSSPRGRYVQAQLSDPAGIFSIAIYDDNILLSARELLDGLKPLFIQAEVRKDEGGVRIMAQSILSLEEYLINKKINLRIWLDNSNSIVTIRNILTADNGPLNTKLNFTIILSDKEIDIEVSEEFCFSVNKISDIEALKGVNKIEVS